MSWPIGRDGVFGLFSSVGSLIVHSELQASPLIWGPTGFLVLGVSALAQTLFATLAVVRMLVLGLIGVPVGMALVVVALDNPTSGAASCCHGPDQQSVSVDRLQCGHSGEHRHCRAAPSRRAARLTAKTSGLEVDESDTDAGRPAARCPTVTNIAIAPVLDGSICDSGEPTATSPFAAARAVAPGALHFAIMICRAATWRRGIIVGHAAGEGGRCDKDR
jgi:hypothetical protein